MALALMLTVTVYGAVEDLPVTTVDGKLYHYYDVQPKETIYSITHKLGVSRDDIVKWNPAVADGLKAHSRLLFPAADGRTTAKIHKVGRGETVYGISRRYGLTIDELMAMNPALKDGLKAGMELNVGDVNAQQTVGATAYRGYVVQEHETLYSIARSNGCTVAQLEEANPGLTVLKAGQVLNIPVAATVTYNPTPAGNEVMTVDTPSQTTITDVPATVVTTENDTPAGQPERVTVETAVAVDTLVERPVEAGPAAVSEAPVKIGVLLPFMLKQEKMSKATALCTEFYKGILLAVDSLRGDGAPVKLYAFDTSNSEDSVKAILKRMTPLGLDMVVGPDNQAQLALIGKWGLEHNVAVMNVLAVKDAEWKVNREMLQGNITHDLMYAKAVKGFVENLGGATPVFVSRNGGPTDKSEFVECLKKALKEQGIKWIDLTYNGKLEAPNVAKLDRSKKYVFVPLSGKQAEFNSLFPGVQLMKDETLAQMGEARLFGYPEWIAFRGESLSRLRSLDTMIFSRFYYDSEDMATVALEDKFRQWFGRRMDAGVPKQGLLGFDTGMFIIKALRHTHGKTGGMLPAYYGVQNGFDFVETEGSQGRVNDVLFLLNFKPGGMITRIIL